jgi:hypothetical protein
MCAQQAVSWDLSELKQAGMINHEKRGRAMPWVWRTALVRSHLHHLACVPWPPPGILSVTFPAPDLSLRLPIGY